jgi:Kef-type K+ transport system membrane component KefB
MHIFIEIGFILLIATFISIIMRILKQPLVVGYILSGIVAGPYVLNIVQSVESIELFAKLGIAILLFIVGLNLRPTVIREVGKVALVTGLGQIIFTSVIGFGLMQILGFGITASIYGAIALTFSSTIIILKLLSDKGDLEKLYGKISIGFLLVQDIVATIILLVVSLSASPDIFSGGVGSIFIKISQALAFAFVLYILSKYILPKISAFLANSQEALFLFSVTWGLGLSALFYYFGLSIEIGALIAGVSLSVSPFSHEIGARMRPLRDFFILIFFVMLGSQMILSSFMSVLFPAIVLSVFVLVGNPIIVIILMNWLGYKSKTGFMAGLTVAQISEFSLILIALGLSVGHINSHIVSLVTLVGIITISGSTYLILYADKIYPKIQNLLKYIEFKKTKGEENEKGLKNYEMIIFGYDRVGYDFVNTAKKLGKEYIVADFNPEAVKKMTTHNIPNIFGDASDLDFLDEINTLQAKIIISTIPDFQTNLELVSYYRNHNKEGIILVISHDIKHTHSLYEAGASFVIMPHYLGAKYASKMIEEHQGEQYHFEKEKEEHLKHLSERKKFTN